MVDVSVEAGALASGGDVRGRVRVRPGGAGANAAVWAADAGVDVLLLGRVGRDLSGRLLGQALEERGVRLGLALDEAAPTGTMLVLHQGDERSMVADRAANARLAPEDLPELTAAAALVSGYLLFDPGSHAAGRAALERADAPVVAVDASSWPLLERFGAERFFEETSAANTLLANEREAAVLCHGDLDLLARRYEHVFVKRGRVGATYGTRAGWTDRPASGAPAEVDVTGAGDAFDGALLAALALGCSPTDALTLACDAGARAVASPDTWPEAVA